MVLTWLAPKIQVFDRIQRDFAFPLKGRLVIIPEVEKYRWKEDESVWAQKRGKSAEQYEVYFDSEFVCFFGLEETQDQVYLKVLESLLNLYKTKKIFWNKELYEVYYPTKKEEVKLPEATTPEEKMLKEAVKRSKKKGKRVQPAK